jgi:predicted dehydrogenase
MSLDRREFLNRSLAAGMVAGCATFAGYEAKAAASANEKIRVGVMGLSRGKSLVDTFSKSPNAEVAYLCEVDTRRFQASASVMEKNGVAAAQQVADVRKILDDPKIDALVIAAPDHWHAPATIMAVNAGKHVYCEKPASHNAQEGEWMVAAARKQKCTVQLGTQRRSMPSYIAGIKRLHEGAIGKPLLARSYYFNNREATGKVVPAAVPEWLNYDLWQGPAPEREYKENVVHYKWHWNWHWGTAELGNNGVHMIDICRWGLGVDYAKHISTGGGRYRYDDDQQTPDTTVTTFDFGDRTICWEQRSFYRPIADEIKYEAAFFGETGTLTLTQTNYKIYDREGKIVEDEKFTAGDAPHIENFIACIRDGKKPAADIEEGHKSTLLCHLGNIAYRTGKSIMTDPTTHKPTDAEAAKLWGREYRAGWEPKV